jgi:hypothetical protein
MSGPRHILERIKSAVREGRYEVTEHAVEEAEADGFGPLDVVSAVLKGDFVKRFARDPRGTRYKIRGPAEDGRIMYLVCRFTECREVRIVTVYAEEHEQ